MSDRQMRKVRLVVAGSKAAVLSTASSTVSTALRKAWNSSSARAVGCSPAGPRTKSGSPSCVRNRESECETVGWVSESSSAARVTLLAL